MVMYYLNKSTTTVFALSRSKLQPTYLSTVQQYNLIDYFLNNIQYLSYTNNHMDDNLLQVLTCLFTHCSLFHSPAKKQQ